MSITYHISNNLNEFLRLTKEQNWNAKEAIISIRDTFWVSYKNAKVYIGEIDTTVSFNDLGDLEILNLSIDKDTFKIINHRLDVVDMVIEQSKGISISLSKKNRKRASIYYNIMLDSNRSSNSNHYDMLVLALSNVLIDSELFNKKRSSSF